MKDMKKNLFENIIGSTLIAGSLLSPFHANAFELVVRPSATPEFIDLQPIRISIRDFQVRGLKIINFIPHVLKNQEAYDFFMENPRLALRVRDIDPTTVDINALRSAIYDLSGRYSWWDVTFVSPLKSVTSSKSHVGSQTHFDPSKTTESSASYQAGSHTTWDGESPVDNYLEQIARWKEDGAGFLPLITAERLDSIMVRSTLATEDYDTLKIGSHHAANLDITRLIGDLAMDRNVYADFTAKPASVLARYGLSVSDVDSAMVVKAVRDVAFEVGYRDETECERYPETNIPVWFSNDKVMAAITEDVISSVENTQGLAFNPSGWKSTR